MSCYHRLGSRSTCACRPLLIPQQRLPLFQNCSLLIRLSDARFQFRTSILRRGGIATNMNIGLNRRLMRHLKHISSLMLILFRKVAAFPSFQFWEKSTQRPKSSSPEYQARRPMLTDLTNTSTSDTLSNSHRQLRTCSLQQPYTTPNDCRSNHRI